MDRSKVLYVVFFVILFLMNSYIYFNVFYLNIVKSLTWHHYSIDIFTVLLYLIVIIPLTAFLSEKLVKYSLKKGLEKSKNFKVFIAVIITIPILFFSFIMFNEYREKGLDEVITINTAKFDYLEINNDLRVDHKGYADGLSEFLSQYRVKKMRDDWWDTDVSKEKGIQITIYSNGKPLMATILENRVSIYNNGDVYKVLNGPIDMGWVEKMYKVYR